MKINTASFVISNTDWKKSPAENRLEYAFIGRSNVGKSSLINMLTNHKNLAKTSGRPGKTQLINHFLINDHWFLVDLPGYGYAKVSKSLRRGFGEIITSYIENRKNLINLFVLIDSRHEPQKLDMDFMKYLGETGIPFSIVFTKTDKLTKHKLSNNMIHYKSELAKIWDILPKIFITSAESKMGKEEVLEYIGSTNEELQEHFLHKLS
ncbi:MAG: YihA family ribosome biogenesis GTP-binding protein [Flavobacteriales bacterium]|nr:YihA family ribosome biogenesis GTP-binding protein [Flavobacteriales bacterium]